MSGRWIGRAVAILAACAATTFFLTDHSKQALASWTVVTSGPLESYGEAMQIPAGGTPTATPLGNSVTVSWPTTYVAPGVPADGYHVTRYNATTGLPQTIGSACDGLVTATQCTETSVPDGSWKYSVQPVMGTNWLGTEGPQSATATVFAGTATITGPANGQGYNQADYNAACATSDMCGTATASSGATVTGVFVSVRRVSSGLYWNGSSFGSATEITYAATGTTSWTYAFPAANFPAAGSYTVKAYGVDNGNYGDTATSTFTYDATAPPAPTITSQPASLTNQTTATFQFTDTESGVTFECSLNGGAYSACTSPRSYSGLTAGSRSFAVRALDAVGNASASTTYNWTIDTTAPAASDVQAVNGSGTAGKIDTGDTLTFTFSEAVSPSSVKSGWNGTSTAVTVSLAQNGTNDSITISGTNLGTVTLDNQGKKAFTVNATMVMTGNTVVITITSNNPQATVGAADNMVWTPGTGITDAAGNALPTTARTETGTLDADF